MIEGVTIRPLKQIPDERGKVMHMLRADDPHFRKFGEIYFSGVYWGKIKGWHRHREMVLNYAVVFGEIKLVLFDDRSDSPTRGEIMELSLGPKNYSLVTVPVMVWNGFQGLSEGMSLVANCATLPHDPEEIERIPPDSEQIPYRW